MPTAPRGGAVRDCAATAEGGDAEGIVLDGAEHGAKIGRASPALQSRPALSARHGRRMSIYFIANDTDLWNPAS